MTQEEKLNEAKRLYKTANADQRYVLESLFPELKESKDEKTKRILHSISNKMSKHLRDIFSEEEFQCFDTWSNAWLENRGEQKLVDKIQLGNKYKCIASPRYSTFIRGKIYKPEDKFLCSLMNFYSDCFEPIEDGEQKPADLPKGEDYGIDGLYATVDILQKTLGKVDGYQTDDGILEHECAISAVKSLYEQKPAWSEEDEREL